MACSCGSGLEDVGTGLLLGPVPLVGLVERVVAPIHGTLLWAARGFMDLDLRQISILEFFRMPYFIADCLGLKARHVTENANTTAAVASMPSPAMKINSAWAS